MKKIIAMIIAIITLFSICAFAAESGEWITDGDICYWSENGTKSLAHKHTEEVLAEYITGYTGDYAIIGTCPICQQSNFRVAHEHQIITEGPTYINLENYSKTGNYVYDSKYHWYRDYCTVEECDYEKFTKREHSWYVETYYDAETGKDTTHKTCTVCGYETETTGSHKHNYVYQGTSIVCNDGNTHTIYKESVCVCGKTSRKKIYSCGHHLWWDEEWYENGRIYQHWYCMEGCGDEFIKDAGPCDHKEGKVTFTYKAIEGSDLIEKVCDCCGKTVEYVENNVSSTNGTLISIEVPEDYDGNQIGDKLEIKIIMPIRYENPNKILEGEFTVTKLCYVSPYSASKGVNEKTVFTNAKFWSVDEYGNVTYELITGEGLVGFAHEANINW